MYRTILITLLLTSLSVYAQQAELTFKKEVADTRLLVSDPADARTQETYTHESLEEWGYAEPQKDTFILVHPKKPQALSPLYVVLHSAGHDVHAALKCTKTVGNHDIYHAPDDMYALYFDCRANQNDWWWGGMHPRDKKLIEKNSGPDPMPVERRVVSIVKYILKNYAIDPNRVYLCGNSMGGSGALGVGMPRGDLFAAIKANVPAGIEHVSNRMGFPPFALPADRTLPDPPIVIDYSGVNDGWSRGHDRFFNAMNERQYALLAYWGPFGHANNHAKIIEHNDLINSFDWLSIKKNEAYPVFTNASSNDTIPWPDRLDEKAPGQINAFFRWKVISDAKEGVAVSLFLATAKDLETRFAIPEQASADVTLRRIQHMRVAPGHTYAWQYGETRGDVVADANTLITVPGLKITGTPATLTIRRH